MPPPAGFSLPLSPPRRLMGDLLYFARQVPTVAVQRRLRLSAVAAARAVADPRPGWGAVFTKAFGMVAAATPPLRQAYLPFPWPRLYQHSVNVALLPVERRLGDEDAVLFAPIREPEKLSLCELDARLRGLRDRPLEAIGAFRRWLRLSRLPRLLRRLLWRLSLHASGRLRGRVLGTFAVTGLGGLGAASPLPPSVLTAALSCGVVEADGTADVSLVYDARVLDGPTAARALADLERVLAHEILAELRYLEAVEAA